MYTLQQVNKTYGNTIVFNDVSRDIDTDQFLCIVGPSGSGKSTLLRLLVFTERPDEGEVILRMDGETFTGASTEQPWPMVTCVFQRQFLWPHLTVRQNVLLPIRRLPLTEQQARLADVVNLLHMQRFLDRYPNEVSGGEAQRTALARALALKPKLILIDEPHGGLDLEQQTTLNQHLLTLRATGIGLYVVTHSLEFACRYADTLLVVENTGISTVEKPHALGADTPSPFLKKIVALERSGPSHAAEYYDATEGEST